MMAPIPYKRSCVKITDKTGKEVIYRWYDEHQQSVKWNGPRLCEHCGKVIETWEFFYWRLYGLCDACYSKGEPGWVDDHVIESDDANGLGRKITTVDKPGGKNGSSIARASYRKRCDDWWKYDSNYHERTKKTERRKRK